MFKAFVKLGPAVLRSLGAMPSAGHVQLSQMFCVQDSAMQVLDMTWSCYWRLKRDSPGRPRTDGVQRSLEVVLEQGDVRV